MEIHYNKQSQFELFPGASGSNEEKEHSRFFLTNLTFSLENCVVLGVVAIMCLVLSFSLGVERGKKIVQGGKNRQNVKVAGQNIKQEKVSKIRKTGRENAGRREAQPLPAQSVKSEARHVAQAAEAVTLIDSKVNVLSAAEVVREKIVDKVYTIQVASFRKEEYAQKEASNLKKKGYDIFVIPKGKYSIVCVGKFAHKDEAKSFSRKLEKKYKDFLIRSL